jgi:hypothetical protein
MRSGLAVRKAKKGEKTSHLGTITFGKSVPDKTKYVIVDIHYDGKAGKALFKAGLELLKKDKEAVISYVVKKAITYTAGLQKAKK